MSLSIEKRVFTGTLMSSLFSWLAGPPPRPVANPPADILTWTTAETRYALQTGDVTVLRSKWGDADEASLARQAAALEQSAPLSLTGTSCWSEDVLPCCCLNTLGPLRGGLVLFCGALIDIHADKYHAVHLGLRVLLIVASFCSPQTLLFLRGPLMRIIMLYDSSECRIRALQAAGRSSVWWLSSLSSSGDPLPSSASTAPLDDATRREIVMAAAVIFLRVLLAGDDPMSESSSALRTVMAALCSSAAPSSAEPPQLWRQQIVQSALRSMVGWICRAVAVALRQSMQGGGKCSEAVEMSVLLWLWVIQAVGPDVPSSLLPSVVDMYVAIVLGDPSHPASSWVPKLEALRLLFRAIQSGCVAPTDAMADMLRAAVRQWSREQPFARCAVEATELARIMVDCDNSALQSLGPLMEIAERLISVAVGACEWDAEDRVALCRATAGLIRAWGSLQERSSASSAELIAAWLPQVSSAALELLMDLAGGGTSGGTLSAMVDRDTWNRALCELVAACPRTLFFRADGGPTRLLAAWLGRLEMCALSSVKFCADVLLALHAPPFTISSCPSQRNLAQSRLWLSDSASGRARFEQLLLSVARHAPVDSCADAVARTLNVLAELAASGALPDDCAAALPLFALDSLLMEEVGGRHDVAAVRLMSLTSRSSPLPSPRPLLQLPSLTAQQLRAAAACLRRHQGWLINDGEASLLRKLFASWVPQHNFLHFDIRVIATLVRQERQCLMALRRWLLMRLPSVSPAFFRLCVAYAFPTFAVFHPADGEAILLAVARNL
jgi:hypothetical protein